VPTTVWSDHTNSAGINGYIKELSIRAVAAVYTAASSPPASATASSKPAETGATISQPTASLSTTNTAKGISPVKVGVGAGVGGFAFLALIAAGAYLLLRRRRRRLPTKPDDDMIAKPELPGESIPKHEYAKEVVGAPVWEMADTSSPAELGGHTDIDIVSATQDTEIVEENGHTRREP
jgi:hypothetical protein